MYEKFYGLAQSPFGVGPDPQFYYGTAKHNEALANLTYGIRRRKGFVVLTGEVGTGKTLLLRCLLEARSSSTRYYPPATCYGTWLRISGLKSRKPTVPTCCCN
jgi:type II secretory pathway predicted ATPase ExeA